MKKSLIFALLLTFFLCKVNAQHYQITKNGYDQVNITFTTSDIETSLVKTTQGEFAQISMEDYFPSTEVGKPQLPIMVQLLQIPVCDSIIAVVKEGRYDEVDADLFGIHHRIFPAQPSYSKSYQGEPVFTIDENTYNEDNFYAQPVIRAEKIGIMRDVCLANIYFSPLSYNPVTHKLRIYKSAKIEITYVNADIPKTYELQTRYGSPMFHAAPQAVINPMPCVRDEFAQAPLKYLIVAHSSFAENDDLQYFVNWKKRLGYLVEVAYTNQPEVGTTNTSIINFVKSKYTNATATDPAPTFLLLVGDHAQIPAKNSTEQNSHVTDLDFACLTTGDHLPDCYYGRFSAQNISQLAPQVEKSIRYEQCVASDLDYLGKAVLVAGTDSYWSTTHANGQVNYIHGNYIKTNSTTHQYNTVLTHLYNCTAQAATIRSEIGSGCGWANYTAHGSEDGWHEPAFKNSHIANMENNDNYGIMIGNCCLTGKFNTTECFGEMLLRTPKKGAAVYVGASEVSYWNEDVYWAVGNRSNITSNLSYNSNALGAYDRLFHTHNEDHATWSTCMGAFVQGGNLSVQSSSSNLKRYYWEIYHIFGDPSIRPYMGTPSTMNVSAPDVVVAGVTEYTISAAPYAYVALTSNHTLIAATFADASGNATLYFNPINTPCEIELAVTAQNYKPYFKTINVITPDSPYVIANNVTMASGNYPINGTDVNLSLDLQNLGVLTADNISATITALTPYYTVLQGSVNAGSINASQNKHIDNAFTIHIPQEAIDGEIAHFMVNINWQGGHSSKEITFSTLAPKITKNISIHNTANTSSIMPGDTAVVSVSLLNEGHASATGYVTDVTCNYSNVVVSTPSQNIAFLGPTDSTTHHFNVLISNNVPEVSIVPLYFHLVTNGVDHIDTIYITIGSTIEDFESNNFSSFDWTQSNNPWTITTTSPYAGNYCARSKSNLNNNGTSKLSITINALTDTEFSYFRKVSSEQGYDMFYCYIDDQKRDEASGQIGWTQISIPISAGTHNITFSYEKDYSTSSGSDCAWIDNVFLPGMGTMVENDIEDNLSIESHQKQRWQVFPNPTTGIVTLLNDSQTEGTVVQIFDVYGKLVQQIDITNHILNLSTLSNGVYILKFIGADQLIETTKIIKH